MLAVRWTVVAVEDSLRDRQRRGRSLNDCWDEALLKFGRWSYSVSYGTCSALRDATQELLGYSSMALTLSSFFCGPIESKFEYDEASYAGLQDALEAVPRRWPELEIDAMRLNELVGLARRLGSAITCSG